MKNNLSEAISVAFNLDVLLDEYEKIENPTSIDVLKIISKIYDELIDKRILSLELSSDTTTEDMDDISDFIIDLSDMIVVFIIRRYSKDVSDAPYQISREKISKLRKYLCRIVYKREKKSILIEFFRILFITSYADSVSKASDYRKLILEKKQNPENN